MKMIHIGLHNGFFNVSTLVFVNVSTLICLNVSRLTVLIRMLVNKYV